MLAVLELARYSTVTLVTWKKKWSLQVDLILGHVFGSHTHTIHHKLEVGARLLINLRIENRWLIVG